MKQYKAKNFSSQELPTRTFDVSIYFYDGNQLLINHIVPQLKL